MKNINEIFYTAIKAVDPYISMKSYTGKIASIYKNGKFRELIVICFGKASYSMFLAIIEDLGNLINKCIVITKYGHVGTREKEISGLMKPGTFILYEAGHPVPDENGLEGTEKIIELLKNADKTTLVVCAISGGGSALLVSPYNGISLKEKQTITELLLKSGAEIYELNAVRKHISKVKGGRLAEIAYPAKILSFILSDVIGDRLDVIASGPTSPDETTFNDAMHILKKYNLINKVPGNVLKVLSEGVKGLIPETPKERNKIFSNVENIIIGSNKIAIEAAKQKAEKLGYKTKIITDEMKGEAREAGKWLASKIKEYARPEKSTEIDKYSKTGKESLCFISGGETTVTVKGNGKGGRNMELALAFAIEIENLDGITFLSAGTDGTDGPTDAAGAIVNSNTVKKAKILGLNPVEYLNNNDSYNFFKKTGDLFITGPTGTNVMDIQIIIVE